MVRIRRATLCRRRSSISQRQGFSPRASLACVHAQECSLRALPKARTAPKVPKAHEPGLARALGLISYSSKTVPSVSCVVPDAHLRRFEMPVALPAGPGLVSNVTTAIDAVYEGGLLRPLQPLSLPEHAQVRISVETLPIDAERTEWLNQSERRLLEVWDNDADDVYNELLTR